jgi:hypothetical protein
MNLALRSPKVAAGHVGWHGAVTLRCVQRLVRRRRIRLAEAGQAHLAGLDHCDRQVPSKIATTASLSLVRQGRCQSSQCPATIIQLTD